MYELCKHTPASILAVAADLILGLYLESKWKTCNANNTNKYNIHTDAHDSRSNNGNFTGDEVSVLAPYEEVGSADASINNAFEDLGRSGGLSFGSTNDSYLE